VGGVLGLCALGTGGAFVAARILRRPGMRALPVAPKAAWLAPATAPIAEPPKLPEPREEAPALPPPVKERTAGTVRKRASRARKAGAKTIPAAAPPPLSPEEPAQDAEDGEDEALTPLERLAKGFRKEQERIARAREKLLMEREREEREAAEKRKAQEQTAHAQESLEVSREREAREAERKRSEEARRLREEKAKKAAEEGEARRIRERIRAEREKAEAETRSEKEWRQMTFEMEERRRGQQEASGAEGKWLEEQQRLAREKQAGKAGERMDAGNKEKLAASMAAVETLIDLGRKTEAQKKMQEMRAELKIDRKARQKLEELAGRLIE
jgi:hypothetical protein